ncbi:membrane protein insertion efficiency factor YidD [Methylophilaceae bacterium]|nr:membrane protein insertion efficiency factor YidD [Methylophilaceae bacterium]MDA9096737.1 membrane protein insertion efficiency factor YidD [Methylophilaceae bacterium]MDC0115186.1 membrane protein insertion efficiency factor YidD [Methylophilaceae bacterium]
MKAIVIYVIKIYQYALSPFFGTQCRFTPSCSAYTIEALESFGFFKGSWIAIKRLLRCRPGVPGGLDPLPKKIKGYYGN